MQEHRALILRSNRFLGSALVDKGFITSGDLEAANEKFMQSIQSSDLKSASILSTLLFELKAFDESQLIEHILEEHEIGLIDLNHVELQSLRPMAIDFGLCWATSTIPFDRVDDTCMIATSYYLSAPVIKQWKNLLDGEIVWYASSVASIARGLERLEAIHAKEDAEAETA